MMKTAPVLVCSLVMLLAGCSSGSKKAGYDYSAFVAASPRSIVVAPVASRRQNVQGEVLHDFHAIVAQPLAERGYYVVPPRVATILADQAGVRPYWREAIWADGEFIVEPFDATNIKAIGTLMADLFKVDAVLFVQVEDWSVIKDPEQGTWDNWFDEKMIFYLELDYLMTDAQGEEIWRSYRTLEYRRGGGNWVTEIYNANTKASDDEIATSLARDMNRTAIEGEIAKTVKEGEWGFYYHNRLPPGPYYKEDK